MPTPYDYQVGGAEHLLSGARRYLADDMGLGKTVQAILAINESGSATAAVICPASVVPNWEREWATWGDKEIDFKVYSYASGAVRRRLVEADVIVLDEAHYVKNRKAKRSGNALEIARRADRCFLLSGTPARNMEELWTVFEALWPELLGSEFNTYEKWVRFFCLTRPVRISPYSTIQKVTGHRKDTVPIGRKLLAEVMLRRKLADVAIQLPPLRVTHHRLPYDKTFEAGLREAEKALEELAEEQMQDNPATTKIRRLLGTIKAGPIGDLIHEELETGAYKKIVVGYYHRDVGKILRDALKEYGVVMVDGQTTDRQAAIDQFNTDPNTRVFLGQMQSAGEGLNLQQDCSEIILVEPAWTPDPNRQFIKRVHRIGQSAPVRARIFSIADTLDERVMANVIHNINTQQEIGL